VVDDRPRVRQTLQEAGVELEPSRGLHFRDPWGNLIEVVQYSDVQFTKAPSVLEGMRLEGLGKSESAQDELRDKGLL
jgi:lactoylglutathione lyase